MMNYNEAYNYLLSINNLANREYTKDHDDHGIFLTRLKYFLNILGNPQDKIPHYLHVTGTSGKGSVCILLSNILRAAYPKKKIGLLTSPHPSVITERWEINNKPMPNRDFLHQVEINKRVLEEYIRTSPYDPISFFEAITSIGLNYFASKKVEWAVIEVGCGGRYDSTNTIPHKDVAVITNIGLDHTEILGDTKPKIAFEKAGIIKPGCQVFTAETDSEVLKVIEVECKKQKTNVKIVDTKQYQITSSDVNGTDFVYEGKEYHLNTIGTHQVGNAILCIRIAEHLKIPYQSIYKGLKNTHLPLRMEVVDKNPITIVDGAHNHDKMKTTIEATRSLLKNKKNNHLHLIVGFSGNKDISDLTNQLITLNPITIACTRFTSNIFRKTAHPKTLKETFEKALPHSKIEIFLDEKAALEWSQKQAKKNDLILATGSIFLTGEIRSIFDKTLKKG